ncbi:MAG: GAF domain-containing protein [Anaerolineales bacterium]|nr:GAF domain-containing protein [Anaerolineales bacterium]
MRASDDHRRREDPEVFWASVMRVATEVARKGSSSEQDVLRAVTQELSRLRMRGSVALFDDEGLLEIRTRSLSSAVESALSQLVGIPVAGYRFDPNQVDLYRQALATGEAVFSSDRPAVIRQMLPANLRPLLPRIIRMLGVQPIIAAPLVLDERAIGTINVTAPWLAPEDARLVLALADNIAIALGHVRQRTELERTLRRERARAEMLEAIVDTLDMDQALMRLLRMTCEAVGADAGTIALLEPAGTALRIRYTHGLAAAPHTLPREEASPGQTAVRVREPVLISDYARLPDAEPAWLNAGIRSVVSVPLLTGDSPDGSLSLFTLRKPRPFQQEQLETLQGVARIASIAIRNARLYANSVRRAEEAQALIGTAHAVSSSLDLQTVLRQIAEQARSLLNSDGSRIHLYNPEDDRLQAVVALHTDAEQVMQMRLSPGQGLTGTVFARQEALLVNDTAQVAGISVHVPGTPIDELEKMALVPLQIHGRTIGVMTVLRFSTEIPYTPADLQLLSAFATHAAIAIENADLYGQIASHAQHLEAQVTERTRDLALSEARYRALVETSLAGIFLTDAQGQLIYANQAFHQLAGRPPGSLVGHTQVQLSDLAALPDRERIQQRIDVQLSGADTGMEAIEVDVLTGRGEALPVMFASTVVSDQGGRVEGVTGIIFDIRQRKALEAALLAERDRLASILTNVGDAIVVADPHGSIEYVNPAWERLTGYAASEALGKTSSLIRSGRHGPEVYEQMWATIQGGRVWRSDLVNRRKDGSLYDAAVVIAPIHDASAQVISYVGLQYDISGLKAQDRLKTQFVSDVSHELRTPLTNIRLYLDLLGETADTQKLLRYRETLIREAERLTGLIDDLLSLSRLESGTAQINPVVVHLNEIVTSLVQDRRALAARSGLLLDVVCDPDLPPTRGDPRLLAQVFTNLLTNAMNYTPSGGQVTLCTLRRESPEGFWSIVEVADSGPGIPIDEQPLLFRRFFRGRAGQARGIPGTGLGLAICKEIIEHHQGRITVESQGVPGKGTCFTVWLPAKAPAE